MTACAAPRSHNIQSLLFKLFKNEYDVPMKKILTLLYLVALFLPAAAHAKVDVHADEFGLMKQAVELSAKADVYNAYCNKSSSFADDFIEKFEEAKGLGKGKVTTLRNLQAKSAKETAEALKSKNAQCKDLEFMMQRLEVMRDLKDVSYLLNGVDPSTLPQLDMPDIKALLPPKSDPSLIGQEL
tara:strand:- start:2338 stop:2889 length:552 start_codon:yes stop_codon:yes gene_type:complete